MQRADIDAAGPRRLASPIASSSSWHRTADGLAVVWEDSGGPFAARLTFGVGHRDETLNTVGLTDLTQQLIMQAVSGPAAKVDLNTSHLDCSFMLGGEPSDVAEHLNLLCRAITGLDGTMTAPLNASRRFSALTAEPLLDPFGSVLARRFGPRSLGLSRWPAIDYGLFTPDQVRAHVAHYFTAGNAVLALTGAPPPGLRPWLPQGPRITHSPAPVPATFPQWYRDEVLGMTIGMRAEAGPIALIAINALHARVKGALAEVGIDNWLFPELWLADAKSYEIGISMQYDLDQKVDPGLAVMAARIAWEELRAMAADGPQPEELHAAHERHRTPFECPDEIRWKKGLFALESTVDRELFGGSEVLDPFPDVAAYEVRDALIRWMPSALIALPNGPWDPIDDATEIQCPRLLDFAPEGELFQPSAIKRFFNRGDDPYLVLTEDQIVVNDHQFPHADLLVMQRDGHIWLGHTGHGCVWDVTGFGRGADKAWADAAPLAKRQSFD